MFLYKLSNAGGYVTTVGTGSKMSAAGIINRSPVRLHNAQD